MKKQIFTSLLALTLAAAMTTGVFADESEITYRALRGSAETDPRECAQEQVDNNGFYDDEDGYAINELMIGPFAYDSDDKNLELASVQYGETAYYLLTALYPDLDRDGKVIGFNPLLLSDADSIDGLKVKVDWEEGDDEVKNVSITKKRVDSIGTYDDEDDFVIDSGAVRELGKYGFSSGDYYYMVAIAVEESSSTSDTDLIGDLTLNKSRAPDADEIEFGIAVNVDWEENYRNDTNYEDISDSMDVKAETYYSVKFDSDDELEISFEDESTFTVDISGQGKMLLYYDTEYDDDVASRYPHAELNFWSGNGAKFNRTGEFFLYTGDEEDAQYLYQLNADGRLSEVSGAEYDDSDEGFYFNTRTLGTYVYSDVELDLSAEDSNSDQGDDDMIVTPVEPVVPVNPGTGARA